MSKYLIISAFIFVFSLSIKGIYQYKQQSADGRILIYRVSLKILQEYPLLGLGFDRFKALYMNAQADWFREKVGNVESVLADNTYYAFNEPLQFLVENGFVGLVLVILTVFGFLSLNLNKEYRVVKYLCIGILLSVFSFGLFTYVTDNIPVMVIITAIFAFIISISRPSKLSIRINPIDIPFKTQIILKGLGVIICVFFVCNLLQYVQALDRGYKNWRAAEEAYTYEDYSTSVKLFENVGYPLKEDGDYLMKYGKALAMADNYKQAVNTLQKAKLHLNNTVIEIALGDSFKALGKYKEAEQAYQQAVNMVPNRFYPLFLLAKLYQVKGENAKAFQKANEILSKKVKIPSTAITEMKQEMRILAAKYEKELLPNKDIKLTN